MVGCGNKEFDVMPWDAKSFKRKHNKSLTTEEAKVAAKVANETLKRTGDEGQAIRAGNVAANSMKNRKKK